MNTITTETVQDLNCKEEEISRVEDVIKFFIFVLLILCHKLGSPKFHIEFLANSKIVQKVETSSCTNSRPELSAFECSPVACGQGHVALSQNGVLYTWGKSGNGRLGLEDTDAEYQHPQPVLTLLRLQVNVIAVACGAQHTLALTDFGLFGWGSSRFGQLGIADVQQTNQPRIVESLLSESIVKVQCGQYHSIVINTAGNVFTWGWGVHGQLGHGNAEDIFLPKLVESLRKMVIISVSAGQGHTVLLSKNGDVYTFGCGMFGQLGTGSVLKHSRPQRVNIPERIKIISSGYFHVLAVSRIDNVYTWGCNPQALRLQAQNSRRARHHGSILSQNSSSPSAALGSSVLQRCSHLNGSIQQTHLLPNLINTSAVDEAIVEASCGNHHSVLVTVTGKIFSWGRNSEGQIGNGTRKEQKVITHFGVLKDKKVVHASCGSDFTIAVDSSGKIYGWGQNDGGQIGQKPSFESSTKCSTGNTNGRIITIRTNRRMITITQPCRQSILYPVEIVIPHNELKRSGILDSGSFESDHPVKRILNNDFNDRWLEYSLDLSKLNDPFHGLNILHAGLEIFHAVCDPYALLNHCLNFGNFQAAAKLCMLEMLYDQAVKFQLDALSTVSNQNDIEFSKALDIINFYAKMLDSENIDINQKFLHHVIKFWRSFGLPLPPLESFLHYHLRVFSYPLSCIMFREQIPDFDEVDRTDFLKQLSAKFCLNTIEKTLKEAENGCSNLFQQVDVLPNKTNILKQIQTTDSFSTWDNSIPQDRLWLDIMHNLQIGINSHSAIHLTSNDVDILAKSLLSEKLYSQSFSTAQSKVPLNSCENDAVVFSCGHHYTLPGFQTNVVPVLKTSLQTLLYSLPQTIKIFLSEYQDDVITAACPKCVAAEATIDL